MSARLQDAAPASVGRLPNPALAGFVPRVVNGVLELPVYHMRGGTSTGIVLWHAHLPPDAALREEAIRWIMGVPATGERRGNKQTTGLGRGPSTSNKVFIVDRSPNADADITSTLAQLAADKSAIDWSVNCGNMSAALTMYALDTGLFHASPGTTVMRIFNTNTRVTTDATVKTPDGTPQIPADTEIPGVMGTFPGVELSLRNPVGAKTGKLLPTGNVIDRFAGVAASCVDVAVPMVIVSAADLGKTGTGGGRRTRARPCAERAPAGDLGCGRPENGVAQEKWRTHGCRRPGAQRNDTENLHGRAAHRRRAHPGALLHAADAAQLAGGHRRLLPWRLPACCPGTTANKLARGVPDIGAKESVTVVQMRNPAGVLRARIAASMTAAGMQISSAAYERSSQIFLRGHFPLYGASAQLKAFGNQWQA